MEIWTGSGQLFARVSQPAHGLAWNLLTGDDKLLWLKVQHLVRTAKRFASLDMQTVQPLVSSRSGGNFSDCRLSTSSSMWQTCSNIQLCVLDVARVKIQEHLLASNWLTFLEDSCSLWPSEADVSLEHDNREAFRFGKDRFIRKPWNPIGPITSTKLGPTP